jgi:hypothetical protein
MTTMTEKAIPTAEDLADGIATVEAPGKASYRRIRVDGRTLAYAAPRKDGLVLKIKADAVAKAPQRFQKLFVDKGKRVHVKVTSGNVKTARDLLVWLAK